jgi:hypothetical protein
MSDKTCCTTDTCCEPPPIDFSKANAKPVSPAACGTEACGCSGGVPVFDGVDPRYKRVLWTVIAINGIMFLVEIIAGQIAGSQALKADALDFLGDTVTYGLSLAVIGTGIRTRATAALFKGLSLSVMALWVFGSTVYHTLILGVPSAEDRDAAPAGGGRRSLAHSGGLGSPSGPTTGVCHSCWLDVALVNGGKPSGSAECGALRLCPEERSRGQKSPRWRAVRR